MIPVNKLEPIEGIAKPVPSRAETYRSYAKVGIFVLVFALALYSLVVSIARPYSEEFHKVHDSKVNRALEGLYRLLQTVSSLPTVGLLGKEGDILDQLNSAIVSSIVSYGRGNSSEAL